MEDYTITVVHKPCGQPAELAYFAEETWHWDGEDENLEYVNTLRLSCATCKTYVDAEPS